MKIKAIKKVESADVFNITVDDTHNYISSIGIVLKNCDALRYFCVYRSRGNKDKGEPDMYLAGADREYSRFNSTDMYNIYGKEKNGQSGTDYNPMYL